MPSTPKRFADLFERVIRRHMIADVPVGVSLSGGLDSSGVSSVMASLMRAGADTHTEGRCTPSPRSTRARRSTRASTCTRSRATCRASLTTPIPTVDEFWDEISEWIWYQEEPTISSAPYAYYSVYRIAKGHVKVILSGNGGDELLAGYLPYFRAYLSSAIDQRHFLAAVREVVLGRDLYARYARELVGDAPAGRATPLLDAGPARGHARHARRVRLPPEPQSQRPAGRRRAAVLDAQPASLRGQELHGLLDRVPGPLPRPRPRRVHLPAPDRPEDQEGMEPVRVPSGHEGKDARGQSDQAVQDRLHEPGGRVDTSTGPSDPRDLLLERVVVAGDLRLRSPRGGVRRVAARASRATVSPSGACS